MKVAIIDCHKHRGKLLKKCIKNEFSEAQFVLILSGDAVGPGAIENISNFQDEFDFIFVHHEQLELACKLSSIGNIIKYTAFYGGAEKTEEGKWIEANVDEVVGVSISEIRIAMGFEKRGASVVPSKGESASQVSKLTKNSKLTIWHALATKTLSSEETGLYLKALEDQHGDIKKARKYRMLYENNSVNAYKYANKQKKKFKKNDGSKYDQSLRSDSSAKYEKRQFSVLLVDDNVDNYEALKSKLKQYLLENDEPFEATVIHFDTTKNIKTRFGQLQSIQAVIFDDRLPSTDSISEIIKKLNGIRPNIPFYISGSKMLEPQSDNSERSALLSLSCVKAYEYKDEKRATALFDGLLADLKERVETPYFTALNKYATERKSAFHALPITDGGSVNDSPWTREFTDFYRRKFFAAETSNTKEPLSSVFLPQGGLKRALEKTECAFHSDRSLFITSGTTISNLIVYKIHIRKGDIVLLDWNCHKSHHNAMVECGAKVKYLQSEHNDKFEISGLVSIKYILQQIRKLKEANQSVKMISLTHPSFDGMLYDVEELMREASKLQPGIIFFFDEAWFAYGAFFPVQKIRYRSAMLAAEKIRKEARRKINYSGYPESDVRVYVTHSIHKTLSSIRQGSMLHIHDPRLKFSEESEQLHLEYMIDNAYETYITTSPNNSILGSLDIARMQAEMEAYDRIKSAIDYVDFFKTSLKEMCENSSAMHELGLKIIEHENLISNSFEDNVLIDPLKVTIYFKRNSGAEAVKNLNLYNIQINKYSANTVLLLFSIGTTKSNVNHLLSSLNNWAAKVVKSKYYEDERLMGNGNCIPEFHKNYIYDDSEYELQIACLKEINDELHSDQLFSGNANNERLYSKSGPKPILKCIDDEALKEGNLVAAQAITPYPPGSPVIVAGQILTKKILENLIKLKKTGGEIHGVVKNKAGDDCIIVSKPESDVVSSY